MSGICSLSSKYFSVISGFEKTGFSLEGEVAGDSQLLFSLLHLEVSGQVNLVLRDLLIQQRDSPLTSTMGKKIRIMMFFCPLA